tara:strand:- start:575 stop:766 length:192 start_codon:yes stop_codon:yes gene_type:complete
MADKIMDIAMGTGRGVDIAMGTVDMVVMGIAMTVVEVAATVMEAVPLREVWEDQPLHLHRTCR